LTGQRAPRSRPGGYHGRSAAAAGILCRFREARPIYSLKAVGEPAAKGPHQATLAHASGWCRGRPVQPTWTGRLPENYLARMGRC
jgi:hypothetical protein